MINKKRLLTIVALLLMTGLSVWLIISSHHMSLGKNKPQTPDAFATNIEATKMDKFGKPKSVLKSPKSTHYQQNDTTQLEKPFIILYKQNEPPWHIHADHGTAIHGSEKITLYGHVKFRQLPGTNSHYMTLTTSEMTFYPDRSFAETDKPVTIRQPGNIVHAVGLQADTEKSYIKLLSKTRGQYGQKITGLDD